MRDLNKVAKECMSELDAIGIEYGYVSKFEVNTRAKHRWGQTCRKGDVYTINISSVLLDERTDYNGLKATIIHELLHTCEDCMCHTGEWRRLANKVNRYYPYNIQRTASNESVGLSEAQQKEIKEKEIANCRYQIQCKKCGRIVRRSRASNFTKHPENYKCGFCGGSFITIK
jgi:predicted SprT family Zn-dependent metalloprotease